MLLVSSDADLQALYATVPWLACMHMIVLVNALSHAAGMHACNHFGQFNVLCNACGHSGQCTVSRNSLLTDLKPVLQAPSGPPRRPEHLKKTDSEGDSPRPTRIGPAVGPDKSLRSVFTPLVDYDDDSDGEPDSPGNNLYI